MNVALTLLCISILLRWPPLMGAVYRISLPLAKCQQAMPVVSAAVAAGLVALVVWAPAEHRWLAAPILLPLIFAGPRLAPDQAEQPPMQAEQVARVIRRYFVPLPWIGALGVWGILVLWWLRFGWLPRQSAIRRWLNLRTGQLVGLHMTIWRQERQLTEWLLAPRSNRFPSLYHWCGELVSRATIERPFRQLWRTLALLRWQWIAAACGLQLLLA